MSYHLGAVTPEVGIPELWACSHNRQAQAPIPSLCEAELVSIDINSGISFARVFYGLLNVVAETGTDHHSLVCVWVVLMSEILVLYHMSNCRRSRGFSQHGCGWQPTVCEFSTNPSVPHHESDLAEGMILVSIAIVFQNGQLEIPNRCRYAGTSQVRTCQELSAGRQLLVMESDHTGIRRTGAAPACLHIYVQVGGHTV